MTSRKVLLIFLACVVLVFPSFAQELRGTGDLGLIVERAKGSIQLIDTTKQTLLQREIGRAHV